MWTARRRSTPTSSASTSTTTPIADGVRIVQLTPPGSGCSVVIGKGAVPDMPPGSLKGLQLVVNDVPTARRSSSGAASRSARSMVFTPTGQRPYQDGDELNNDGFVLLHRPGRQRLGRAADHHPWLT